MKIHRKQQLRRGIPEGGRGSSAVATYLIAMCLFASMVLLILLHSRGRLVGLGHRHSVARQQTAASGKGGSHAEMTCVLIS